MEYVDQVAGRDRSASVCHTTWNYEDFPWCKMVDNPINGQFKFPTNQIDDLFVWVAVILQGRTLIDLPVGDGHVVAVDKPDVKTWDQFNLRNIVQVN